MIIKYIPVKLEEQCPVCEFKVFVSFVNESGDLGILEAKEALWEHIRAHISKKHKNLAQLRFKQYKDIV